MTLDKFIEGFDNLTNKDAQAKYIQKHVNNYYVPYVDKINTATRVVNASSYNEGVFHINTPARYMLTMIAVFEFYTDVELNTDAIQLQFDMIEKRGINDMLISIVGDDYDRFMTVIKMVFDDLIINTRDLTSFLETKVDAFNTTLNQLLETFEDQINGAD